MSNSTSQGIRSAVQQVRMEKSLFLPVLPGPHGPGVADGRFLPGTAQSRRNLSERQAPQADWDHPYGFAQLPSKKFSISELMKNAAQSGEPKPIPGWALALLSLAVGLVAGFGAVV